MTKSQMFKKAHEIARKTLKAAGGNYSIAFQFALKQVWVWAKDVAESLELTGSAKQKQWARDIVRKAIRMGKLTGRKEFVANVTKKLDSMKNKNQRIKAADIIEARAQFTI